jgi:hypothetical protein
MASNADEGVVRAIRAAGSETRPALWVTAIACVLTGCGHSNEAPTPTAVRTADRFMHALVAERNVHAAAAYASPSMAAELPDLARSLRRAGIYRQVRPGNLSKTCEPAVRLLGSPPGRNCIVYRLHGHYRDSQHESYADATFRVWMVRAQGDWKVDAYDYSARVRAR